MGGSDTDIPSVPSTPIQTGMKAGKRIPMKIYGVIYCITRPVTNQSYIGQTTNYKQRVGDHFSGLSRKCTYVHRAIQKYGRDAFTVSILAEVPDGISDPQGTLDYLEQFYIIELNTISPGGYNLRGGGHGGGKLHQDHKDKIAMALTGNQNSKGVKRSPEFKQAVSKRHLGTKRKRETCIKIAKAKRGTKQTRATCEKRSQSMKRTWYRKKYGTGEGQLKLFDD